MFFSGQGGGNGASQSNSELDIGPEEWVWIRAILLVVLAYVLVVMIVAGPIRGGYDMAVLRLFHGDETVSFRDMFAGFSKFGTLFLTFLLYTLAIIGGFILLVVPGIIVAALRAVDIKGISEVHRGNNNHCDHGRVAMT